MTPARQPLASTTVSHPDLSFLLLHCVLSVTHATTQEMQLQCPTRAVTALPASQRRRRAAAASRCLPSLAGQQRGVASSPPRTEHTRRTPQCMCGGPAAASCTAGRRRSGRSSVAGTRRGCRHTTTTSTQQEGGDGHVEQHWRGVIATMSVRTQRPNGSPHHRSTHYFSSSGVLLYSSQSSSDTGMSRILPGLLRLMMAAAVDANTARRTRQVKSTAVPDTSAASGGTPPHVYTATTTTLDAVAANRCTYATVRRHTHR